MKTMKLFLIGGFCAVLSILAPVAEACTGVTIRATNGDVVFSRTMEWESSSISFEILICPRNHTFQAKMADSKPGMSWKSKYGIVGVAAAGFHGYTDATNEKGLAVGAFYHDSFAQYPDYSPERAGRSITSWDVIPYLLSTCANIDEVRQALEKVEVVHSGKTAFGPTTPLHYMVTEPGGKQVVIEWVGGKVKFFESKLGVIANSPTYDWHLLNLGNYTGVGLPSSEVQERQMGGQTVTALDAGTDLRGLPGDFTSPSRFVRAAILSSYVRRTPNAMEAVYQAFQIMDSFNSPVGKNASKGEEGGEIRSETFWTLAHDLTNRIIYFHTANDRMVQKIDVAQIDFGKLSKPVYMKLDNGEMTIRDRTGEISAK